MTFKDEENQKYGKVMEKNSKDYCFNDQMN